MSYATTFCRAALGIQAPLVTVETLQWTPFALLLFTVWAMVSRWGL